MSLTSPEESQTQGPSTQRRIGFVGLGSMGQPMALNLLTVCDMLHVYDLDTARAEPLVSAGARLCGSPAEIADASDVVFVSLPSPQIVESVALGDAGLIHGTRMNAYVDFSTTGRPTSEKVAASLGDRGIRCLDAPVSGGTNGARSGQLTVMVSGESDLCDELDPYLRAVGAHVRRVGRAPGAAQSAKLINNLLSAAAIALTAEALCLGAASGLDPATLLEIINSSSGRNTASADKFPKHVLTRSFDFGFRLQLMLKDLGLCIDEARERGVPMLLGSQVHQIWATAATELPPEADATEITRLFERLANTTLSTDAADA